MKTKTLVRGAMLACLALCSAACTPKVSDKPLLVRAADPITVTKTEYIPLTGTLLNEVPAAFGFGPVFANGDMYNSLVHDSQWLTTCKAQIDGIIAIYAKQAAVPASTSSVPSPSQ